MSNFYYYQLKDSPAGQYFMRLLGKCLLHTALELEESCVEEREVLPNN